MARAAMPTDAEKALATNCKKLLEQLLRPQQLFITGVHPDQDWAVDSGLGIGHWTQDWALDSGLRIGHWTVDIGQTSAQMW